MYIGAGIIRIYNKYNARCVCGYIYINPYTRVRSSFMASPERERALFNQSIFQDVLIHSPLPSSLTLFSAVLTISCFIPTLFGLPLPLIFPFDYLCLPAVLSSLCHYSLFSLNSFTIRLTPPYPSSPSLTPHSPHPHTTHPHFIPFSSL